MTRHSNLTADTIAIEISVNGLQHSLRVASRRSLADVLREDIGATGVRVGCEHGVCGSCTVLFNGEPVRACLLLAVQADGQSIRTVESLADDNQLHPIQEAFRQAHGLQCGFCTPGILLTVSALLEGDPDPSDAAIMDALGGHLCRCTGYQQILASIRRAIDDLAAST
ncbi:MAG: (2Fe-2S)-binding protein [Pseudomonadales bacterium]|jgi:carbon-monoxide dehydrogenase small subunit|nr:(2Fe-2S)-binding protein [Pseudomonadales bacterium]MDP6829226.1 (2Fe-2S)-binding protein [Pseudomonadales bacterium]MDP6972623.1 (2Fe-2S)-binding protein [Pseudomonadales bacterium]|tara:strand:- start:2805 stop:3308 length:504 start_codon:yes stop_codon:yes gene_type:complete